MYLGDMREWETFPSDSNDPDSDSDDDELPDIMDPPDSDEEEEPERPVAMVTTVAGNMSRLTHIQGGKKMSGGRARAHRLSRVPEPQRSGTPG